MARAKRQLEMLPLLDVFMVILFVFATIQEGKLSATTEAQDQMQNDLELAQSQVAELEEQLEDVDSEAQQQQMEQLQTEMATLQTENENLTESLEQTQSENKEVSESIEQKQKQLDELEQKLKDQIAESFDSEEQVRQQEILERLLDQNSVFEVEIQGEINDQGVVNLCCFRDDPMAETWSSCGQVPNTTGELEEWLRRDGKKLLETLRATKGGNAMTIIRHDSKASYEIGRKLETVIRGEVDEQRVYNEGIAVIEMSCR